MSVQLAAQFFVLVALKFFSMINVFNVLIIILKFSRIKIWLLCSEWLFRSANRDGPSK